MPAGNMTPFYPLEISSGFIVFPGYARGRYASFRRPSPAKQRRFGRGNGLFPSALLPAGIWSNPAVKFAYLLEIRLYGLSCPFALIRLFIFIRRQLTSFQPPVKPPERAAVIVLPANWHKADILKYPYPWYFALYYGGITVGTKGWCSPHSASRKSAPSH